MNNQPIGVLDSGLGGLTILSELIKKLPHESFIYIGDSANIPYGAKSEKEIYLLSRQLIEFLLERKVKLIVIACNTITVTCLDKLRSDYSTIPIVGTVPVIKTAAEISVNKKIGILSTTRTAQSEYQKQLIDTFANGYTVINLGTDKLVPLIESGKIDDSDISVILRDVIAPYRNEGIDTLALGCTHFPYLITQIEKLLPEVKLLDSGGAIARQVERVLQKNDMLTTVLSAGNVTVYTTGELTVAKKLTQWNIKQNAVVEQVNIHNDH